MCHDRKFLVTQEELDLTLEGFKEQFGDKPSERKPARADLMILAAHTEDPSSMFLVIIAFTVIIFRSTTYLFS